MRDGLKFSYKMAALKEKETTVLKKTLPDYRVPHSQRMSLLPPTRSTKRFSHPRLYKGHMLSAIYEYE